MDDKSITKEEVLDNEPDESPAKYPIIDNACWHFPDSNKVNIFPCCERAYSCYECHNEAESHKFEPSIRGYCRLCKTFFKGRQATCEGCKNDFSATIVRVNKVYTNEDVFFRELYEK